MKKNKVILVLAIIFAFICVPIFSITVTPVDKNYDGYNYSSYRLASDVRPLGPEPGDPFPKGMIVYDIDGKEVKVESLWADKPLVLELGSITCPIFLGTGPTMDELYNKYDKGQADKANIGLLYVREAHPGWFNGSPKSFADKLQHAQNLKGKGVARNIWVDTLQGDLHNAIDLYPNTVYIINTQGTVVYKSIWNVPSEVDRVLDKLLNENIVPTKEVSNHCLSARAYYGRKDIMLYMLRMIGVGGPDALLDVFMKRLSSDRTISDSNLKCSVSI